MPKVSVVIPSYNHARFIGEAVESVLRQSEPGLEIIVVDDGSTDDTLSVLGRFTDSRVRVIVQEHQGAHAAINRGLKESTGQYLSILNSDDVYHPRRLEKLLAILGQDQGMGLVGSYITVIDQTGKPLGTKHGYKDLEPWQLPYPEKGFRVTDDARGVLLTENFYATTSNFVFRRELYELVGEFRSLRFTHDWDFLLRSALITRLDMFPEPLLYYRVHQRNTIRQDIAGMIFEICWCLAVYLPQYLRDASWFDQESAILRVQRLLYSIYTFQCEVVLVVMLLRQLQLGVDWALSLLDPTSPERKVYIEFITERIKKNNQDRPRRILPGRLVDILQQKVRRYVRY